MFAKAISVISSVTVSSVLKMEKSDFYTEINILVDFH